MFPGYFVALFFHVAEGFCVRLAEAFVRTDMLHAHSLRYSRYALELNDAAVGSHLLNLFAILDVDICRRVLLVVLDGEAIAWRRTLAT